MKSYTLANWDGTSTWPEEKTSELPSTGLTGSSSAVNTLASNTQSIPTFGDETGISGQNALLSKDHELGWMDSSNPNVSNFHWSPDSRSCAITVRRVHSWNVSF